MAKRFTPEEIGMTDVTLRQALQTVGVKAASLALRVNEKTLARWLATSKAKDFPITLAGDPGHAAAQRRTVAALLRRNPTPKARAFVSRKIRKLAHEGVPPRQRVAEALSVARRRGFRSVPTRPTRTRNPSEKVAWQSVARVARGLQGSTSPLIVRDGNDLASLATMMLEQLARGVHENPRRRTNPVMGLIANEAPAVFTVSTRVKEIVYIHAQDGDEYVHPFAPGVSATFLQDGRCVLWRRDGKPVGGRRIGNTIRPIGG
jgi:hypothetical protein